MNASRSPLRCSGLRLTSASLLDDSTSAELWCGSNWTKWTTDQPLLHMLFEYLVVRNLHILMRLFGRFPDGFPGRFAALLNAGTHPFPTITYLGSLGEHASLVTPA